VGLLEPLANEAFAVTVVTVLLALTVDAAVSSESKEDTAVVMAMAVPV